MQRAKVKVAALRNPLQWVADLYFYFLDLLGMR